MSFVYQRLKASVKPASNFGPAQNEDRELYLASLEHPEKCLADLEVLARLSTPEQVPLTDRKIMV